MSYKISANVPALPDVLSETNKLREYLLSKVFGQDNAVNNFANGYYMAGINKARDKKTPAASFLFTGPPGVGKTLLAKSAAECLDRPFICFNMSEYSAEHSMETLIGIEQMWRGAHEGRLTGFVNDNPNAIILFDEVEKAHRTSIFMFLQLLEGAVIKDKFNGKNVSFEKTIVIFTSNAGKQLYTDSDNEKLSLLPRKTVIDALMNDKNPTNGIPYFPPEICSRFARGNVIMFDHMTPETLEKIVSKTADSRFDYYKKNYGLYIKAEPDVISSLVFRSAGSDARTVCGRAESFFDEEILELLSQGSAIYGEYHFCDNLRNISFSAELEKAAQEVREIFRDSYTSNVILMSDSRYIKDLAGYKFENINVYFADNFEKAVSLAKRVSPSSVITDLFCGKAAENKSMSIDDIDSEGRKFFDFIIENMPDTSVYIAQTREHTLRGPEKRALLARGARGFTALDMRDLSESFEKIKQNEIGNHKLRSALKLASANKQLSFETRQELSSTGISADIILYNFRLKTSVSADDKKDMVPETSRPDMRFSDVIGAEDAKNELMYFVNYLKDPRQYIGMGVRQPRGVLLYGPPGTGKTMLAKACAGESDVTFISTDGTNLLDPYGDTVKALFKKARKYAPSIIFIDEIDIVGKRRGDPTAVRGADSVLNSLLTHMDGFSTASDKPVFVLAATNYGVDGRLSDMCLDPALVRRFDRRIFVDLPAKEDRRKFLKVLCQKNAALSVTESFISNIASRSEGMSLAELSNIVEFSLRNAIRLGSSEVTNDIFNDAFETCTAGESNKIDSESIERIAYHEAGHAVLSCAFGRTPVYLTISSRGNYGGYMMKDPDCIKTVMTKKDLFEEMIVALGGAAAEKVFFGEHSSGIENDLKKATSIAYDIVCNYGMAPEYNFASIAGADISDDIRRTVNNILSRVMETAENTISRNREITEIFAENLIARGHMNKTDISVLIGNTPDINKCEFSLISR